MTHIAATVQDHWLRPWTLREMGQAGGEQGVTSLVEPWRALPDVHG